MTIILAMLQFCFTAIIGIYFLTLLKNQNSTQNSIHKDSLKELDRLKKMRDIHLTEPLSEKTRPSSIKDVVGQEDGVRALRAAICGKNPQHVLIYGPAGVGKTAAARVILEEAKVSKDSPFTEKSKFVETDATTMRFDERSIADPLIGSVHDPIYQGAGAYGASGIPQPKEGAVTKAHGGVLFIDEIGELNPIQLNRLLKVLEDRKVKLESAYYSSEDRNIPCHIHDIFQNGLPADFRLIGATTRSPEEISPAIRSRCTEIYFHDLSYEDLVKIAKNAIVKIGYEAEEGIFHLIASYAQNGRDCVNIVQRAASVMMLENREIIALKDVEWVLESGKYAPKLTKILPDGVRIGVVNGLAVAGSSGYVMDIEVLATENYDKNGKVTVTGIVETEQINGRYQNLYKTSSAKASVDNAMTILHKRFGIHAENYDIHINFPGGIPVDGPSAGISIFCAIYSAIFKKEIDSKVAMTGEISIRGSVLPVGGVSSKIEAAKKAGATKVYIPKDNYQEFFDDGTIEISPIKNIDEILLSLFGSDTTESRKVITIPSVPESNVITASGQKSI